MADPEDFARLERKVDLLSEAVSKLVLIEERQVTQGQRIGAVEQRCAAIEAAQLAIDRKVDQWINRGVGVWAVVATLGALALKFTH